jgi:hypothetical protein
VKLNLKAASFPDILAAMQSLTEELRRLEQKIDLRELETRDPSRMLGGDPAKGFALITEFKAAIDRMRYISWICMEAAARFANVPVQSVPPALRQKITGSTCSIEEYLTGKERGLTADS